MSSGPCAGSRLIVQLSHEQQHRTAQLVRRGRAAEQGMQQMRSGCSGGGRPLSWRGVPQRQPRGRAQGMRALVGRLGGQAAHAALPAAA
jgi:hypothetical protein